MGISSLLGFLSLLGFVALIGGIGLVVVASSQGRSPRGGVLVAAAGLVIGLLFNVISQGILIVQPQEIAVVFNTLTGDLAEPRSAGTHIIVPVIQEARIYPVSQQEYTMTIQPNTLRDEDPAVDATTIDGQVVSLDITIFYSIDPLHVNTVHQRWRDTYRNYVRSTTRTTVRDVVATFRADAIYGEGRIPMQERINAALAVELSKEHLILNRLDVRGLLFSDQFRQAIEEKIAAEQRAQQAAFVVQQRREEAEQARAQAAGERDANIARAEGEARAIVLRAQAEAQALQLVSEQIAANPALIQYQYVLRLSDNVRLALVPSNSPFLFDLGAFTADPDFVAPAAPEIEVPQTTSPGS